MALTAMPRLEPSQVQRGPLLGTPGVMGAIPMRQHRGISGATHPTLSLPTTPIGVPALELHPPSTMPQLLNPGTNEPNLPQSLHDSLSAIRRTTNAEELQHLQCKVLIELAFRLRQSGARANPHLHDFTDGELLQITHEILTTIMGILSRVRAAHREISDMYSALTERLEPDEGRRIASYYQFEDEDREREAEYTQESELLDPIDPPTAYDCDEEY